MAASKTAPPTRAAHELAPALPADSALDERGRLAIGGCDTIELAREYGTPAYVVAEQDLIDRARAFQSAARHAGEAGHEDLHVVFAAKSFPCTAALELFAREGLWCDVASGGELHLALAAGFAPERIVVHGNAKSEAELSMALRAGVGLVVIDNFDEIDRLARLTGGGAGGGDRVGGAGGGDRVGGAGGGDRAGGEGSAGGEARVQDVLIRVTPDVRGDTHEHISTGQADSKFGFGMVDAREAIARVARARGMRLVGVHAHIGSQLLELEPFRREVAELAALGAGLGVGLGAGLGVGPGAELGVGLGVDLGPHPVWDLGGGLGVRYTAEQPEPPSVEAYVGALVEAASEHGMGPGSGARLLIEPGRSLTATAGVTLYTVESVKRNVRRWVAVDGGMSDNMRPMLYGARYEAHVADRLGGTVECVLAGKHCESGDVIVREALLDDPRAGDVIVTPATGAYGWAMASNYNGVTRPPVIFCRDGRARVVVRRETFDDLTARDVGMEPADG